MKNKLFNTIATILLCITAANAQVIKIMPGTTFKHIGTPYTIVLANDAFFENNANVQGLNLIIKATGSGTSQIKGSGSLSIGQILVNKAAGQSLQLLKDVNIAEDVTFNTGLLDLNGHNLLLADTASLVNESNTSHVVGTLGGSVQIQADLNAPLAENPGNLGLIITSGANWGNTIISRSHNTFTNPNGGSSIARNYNIQPTTNTALNAFLRMYYFDDEINSLNENTFDFFQSTDNGANWNNIGSVSRNVSQNFVNINGIQSLSLITLSTADNPLPLFITDLTAGCDLDKAVLKWRLPNPQKISSVQVEKSNNGTGWELLPEHIGMISDANYLYTFKEQGTSYSFYRLKCIGIGEDIHYSSVQPVNCQTGDLSFKLVQNPVRSAIQIDITASYSRQVAISLYDIQGRLVFTKPWNITTGNTSAYIDASNLSAGLYHLKIGNTRETLWQTKLVKQ